MQQKTTRCFIFFYFIFCCLDTNSQSYVWARSEVGIDHAYCNTTVADKNGNVYVGGHFFGDSASFGNKIIHNSNTSFSDFFIVKYDPSGNVLWAKSWGGFGNESCTALAIDLNGNIMATGWYLSPTFILGSFVLSNAAQYFYDVFVAKFDANGNVMWAKSTGGTNDDKGMAVATDNKGNTFVTGSFKSTYITFGAFMLTNIGPGYEDFFVIKYDAFGNIVNAKSFGDYGPDVAQSIITDDHNNIFICGTYLSASLNFGIKILQNAGVSDIFVVKLDSSLSPVWAQGAGSNGYDNGAGITRDKNDNIFVCGFFKGNAITFGNFTLTNTAFNFTDAYLVKFDMTGNVVWAKSAGGDKDDYPYATIVDNDGNIFLTGSYTSSTFIVASDSLLNKGYEDIFILKFNPSGNIISTRTIGSNRSEVSGSVSIDASNNLYVGGSYSSNSLVFGNDTLHNKGYYQSFIAKISSNTVSISESGYDLKRIELFPNPSNGNFRIMLHELNRDYLVEIIKSTGEKVYSEQLHKYDGTDIHIGKISSGIYFILFTNSDKTEIRKLIIE